MTWRSLEEIARGAWIRTSFVLAKIHNANVMKRSDAVTPDEMNPMRKRQQRQPPADIGAKWRSIGQALAAGKKR